MGVLSRFRLSDELVSRYPVFVETGTGRGVSLSYAAEHKFERLISIDIDPRLTEAVAQRFAADERVEFYVGPSHQELKHVLADLRGQNVIFWLDAHSPGGDYFGADYAAEPDRVLRLPLQEEIELIWAAPLAHIGDFIIVVDDRRIYEDDDYAHGNLPPSVHNLSGAERSLAFVDELFGKSHQIVRSVMDDGYLLVIPRDSISPMVILKYDVAEQVAIARRNVVAGDVFSARVEYHRVLDMTQPLEQPDLSIKRVARGEACRFMATFAKSEHHEGSVIDWFLEAAAADPLAIEHRIDLIFQSLIPRGDLKLAKDEAEKAVRIAAGWLTKADEARAYRALADVERQLGDAKAMERAVEKAKLLDPFHVDTLRVEAMFLADTSRFDEAEEVYNLVVNDSSQRGQGFLGLSIVHSRRGDHEAAIACIEAAIASGLDDPMAEWRLSDELLTIGRYAEGWKGQSARFQLERKMPGVGPAGRRFLRPVWDRAAPPCAVHVHAEQGYGDVICMARYLLELKILGHDVRCETTEPMVDLFRESFEPVGIKVVPLAADYPGAMGLDDFDRHVPMMSFPTLFETTIETVPWCGPYLYANIHRVAEYGRALPRGRRRIGLCWKSGSKPGLWHREYARRKSMPFEAVEPLVERLLLAGDAVVSLLVDETGEDPRSILSPYVAIPLGSESTWADTAAIVANLDIVVTVDTGVAHLAGAMGKKTLLAMHTPGASWHWMENRSDSPWYPTVKIFRQERPHEWTDVVDRMIAALFD